MEILFLLTGLTLGFGIAWLLFKRGNTDTNTAVLETRLQQSAEDMRRLSTELSTLREISARELALEREKLGAEIKNLSEKLGIANMQVAREEQALKSQKETLDTLREELNLVHKKYSTEFENIASKILEEKSQKFTDQNKSNLDIILSPLKEKIKDFEEKVDKTYKAESAERITLKAEIKHLVELNTKISLEANNLATALKGDNKMQGNWGEVILEKIMERSGLEKDREYRTQVVTSNVDGNTIKPDVVVMLPDNKHIVIDSKVSLLAYEAMVNSTDEELKARLCIALCAYRIFFFNSHTGRYRII
jgi:DNA recombination protein RmuC